MHSISSIAITDSPYLPLPCPALPSQLMDRELLPSLHKLEQQCEQYHEFAHLSQRNETLKRQCVAYNYMETQK